MPQMLTIQLNLDQSWNIPFTEMPISQKTHFLLFVSCPLCIKPC